MAMGVVALAALAASALMVTQSTWARQAELTVNHVQAQLLIGGGLDWARAVLSYDRLSNNIDHLGEPWAMRLPPIPVDKGNLTGYIEDQNGKFNLNNIVRGGRADAVQLANFRRLLATLGLPENLADTLCDWVDADSAPQPSDGAEDESYLALQAPYLAANRPLTDLAELALVRGFDRNVRARLARFVTALPRFTAVNVNTAPPEVLCALVEGLKLDDARAIVAQRERGYFRSSADFNDQLPRGLSVRAEDVAVSSDFFIATMRVSLDGAQARGSALLARERTGWPVVVWRKYP
jgi:general secretion pathway protein K